MSMWKSLVGTAGLVCAASIAAAATPKADYQFQGNFNSSILGAPALTTEGTGSAGFASETVDGQPRTVYQFNSGLPGGAGAGLIANTTGLISPANYSIVLYARLDAVSNGLSKLVDFKNLTSDAGVYNALMMTTFYNAITPEAASLTAYPTGTYAQLALTRSAAGTFTAYLSGSQIFSFNDSSSLAVIDDPNSTSEFLHFFFDDPNSTIVTSDLSIENPSGAVARIRLYDGDLTASEVAALDTIPEPAAFGLLMVGVGMGLLRRRREV